LDDIISQTNHLVTGGDSLTNEDRALLADLDEEREAQIEEIEEDEEE
jgi:hypothetical protein